MQREKMKTIVVCTSLAGILLLYGYSLTLEPKFIVTAEVADHVGQMVRLEGYVVDLSTTPGGDSAFMTLRDDHGTVSVFVKGDIRNVAMDARTDGGDTQGGAGGAADKDGEGNTDGDGEGGMDEDGEGNTDGDGDASMDGGVDGRTDGDGKRDGNGTGDAGMDSENEGNMDGTAEGTSEGTGDGNGEEAGDSESYEGSGRNRGDPGQEDGTDPVVPVSDPQTRYGAREKRGAVMVGDLIVITGQVYESERGYGISVSGPQFIRILVPWSGKIITLQALTSNPARFEGMNVNLSCRIVSPITDSGGHGYGVVSDHEEGNHSLPVYVYGIPVHRGYRGMEGHVNARFEYRRTSFRYVLIIDGPEHHIWASSETEGGK